MILEHLRQSSNLLYAITGNPELVRRVERASETLISCLVNGGKILLCGNGGSAAIASHLAAELVGRYYFERRSLPAIALTTDTSVLTALSNDYGYTEVFARQIQALGRPGDVLIAMSTSGRSANIGYALEQARRQNLMAIGLFGRCFIPCDHHICVPSDETALVQQVHLVLGHAIIGRVDLEFAKDDVHLTRIVVTN